MAKRVAAITGSIVGSCVLVVVLGTTAVPAAGGCTTHQCDGESVEFYGGEMIDPDTYVTSPLGDPFPAPDAGPPAEPWVDFGPNETLKVTYPCDAQYKYIRGRTPEYALAYVGVVGDASPTPNGAGNNFTFASGSLAEFVLLGSGGFWVNNNTCSSYAARFIVHFPPYDGTTHFNQFGCPPGSPIEPPGDYGVTPEAGAPGVDAGLVGDLQPGLADAAVDGGTTDAAPADAAPDGAASAPDGSDQ